MYLKLEALQQDRIYSLPMKILLFSKLWIKDFYVVERDGRLLACGALIPLGGGLAELVGLGMGIPVPASVEIDMEKKQLIAEFEANNFVSS